MFANFKPRLFLCYNFEHSMLIRITKEVELANMRSTTKALAFTNATVAIAELKWIAIPLTQLRGS